MNNKNIDMGNMTSRQIGNLMSKTLIERDKKLTNKMHTNVDYGNIPSKTLIDLGKKAFSNDDISNSGN